MRVSSILLLVAIVGGGAPRARATEWLIQGIDCPNRFGAMSNRYLGLDASLLPHMAYGEDHLYHAWFDGTVWNHETVDPEDRSGHYASLAVAGNGDLHVSYGDVLGGLRYAVRRGGAWTLETVDTCLGSTTSIAVASSGIPCISYFDDENCDLRYGHREASGWIIDVVDSKGHVGAASSVALDAEDHPHISYADYQAHRLKHAYNDGSGWVIQVVADDVGYPIATSIAVGNDGSVHICVTDQDFGRPEYFTLRYSVRPGPADPWQTETLCPLWGDSPSASLALGVAGIPHIAFSSSGDLNLTFKDESGWQFEVLYEPGYAGPCASLVLTDNGTLHAAFYDMSLGALRHLMRTGASTTVELVDAEGSAGQSSSIAVSSANHPHISYHYDDLYHGLKHAWEDETGWHTEVVDSSGMCAVSCAMALDTGDRAHIAYSEGLQDDLRYARRDETGWTVTTVDSDDDVGHWVSLALDGNGFPHISYGDWTVEWSMKYAYEDEVGWHVQTFDDGWMVGGRNAIAVDSNRKPHVIYVPFASAGLIKYAWMDQTSWHIEVIEQGDFEDVAIALDDDDVAHVCYTAWANDALIYARRIDGVWYQETVEEGAAMLSAPSITLDVAGFPHLSYSRGASYQDLRYAYQDGLGWHLLTADPDGHSMWGTDIALDDFGIPHMSYFKTGMEDLIYVRMVQPQNLMLSWAFLENSIHFSWIPVPQASAYWVYGGANRPHFAPGSAPGYEYRLDVLPLGTTSWVATDSPGNPEENWTYLIMAVNGTEDELVRSLRVGEFDWTTDIP